MNEWAVWGFQAGQPYLQGLHRTRLGAKWWARSLRRRGYGPIVVRRLP